MAQPVGMNGYDSSYWEVSTNTSIHTHLLYTHQTHTYSRAHTIQHRQYVWCIQIPVFHITISYINHGISNTEHIHTCIDSYQLSTVSSPYTTCFLSFQRSSTHQHHTTQHENTQYTDRTCICHIPLMPTPTLTQNRQYTDKCGVVPVE